MKIFSRSVIVLAVAAVSSVALAQQPRFQVLDVTRLGFVPVLEPGIVLRHGAISINNRGQVVYTRDVILPTSAHENRAFVYLPEDAFGQTAGIIELSNTSSAAWDINLSGQIVGQIDGITETTGEAHLWQLGATITATPLGFLEEGFSAAYAINDAIPPIVVGHSTDGGAPICNFTTSAFRLAFAGAKTMIPLAPSAPNDAGYARAINTPATGDALIIGFSTEFVAPLACADLNADCLPDEEASRWIDNSALPIEASLDRLAGGGGHEARGVNDSGQIVGQGYDSTMSEVCLIRAMYWEDDAATVLNIGSTAFGIPAAQQTRAEAINNPDPVQVAGANLTTAHALLWEQDGSGGWNDAIDLNDEIDPASDWTLVEAHDINDKGCIAGWGLLNAEVHAFVAYECPTDCDGNSDAFTGITDFLQLLADWGQPSPCDLDGGGVGINDFLELLSKWGACCSTFGFSGPPQSVQDCINRYGTEDPLVLEGCICTVEPEQCQ